MAYYPTRETVRRNQDLLTEIRYAVTDKEPLVLEPQEGQSVGGARYWVRNLLKSAEIYSDFGYADLAGMVTVGITNDGRVRIVPKTGPSPAAPTVSRFDEMMAMSELMADHASRELELTFWPTETFDAEGFIEASLENGWEVMVVEQPDGSMVASCTRFADRRASPFDLIGGRDED